MTGPAPAAKVNLSELLENSAVGPLQIRVFVLCMICLIMDGFDVQAMGYAGPALVADWGIGRPALGPVFAAANFGVLVGSLLFTMLADVIGRRPVIIWATLFFSVMTIATGFAQNIEQLYLLRFISGLGLGCIVPNATALVGEFSPKRSRVTLTMGITVGFTAGAAIGGFVALWLIPLFGWRSVFFVGGAVPLVIAVAMFFSLPESLQFLAVRRTRLDMLAYWLKKLDPSIQVNASTEFVSNEKAHRGVPIVHLFREGRSTVTILLWVVYFMNLLNLYSLSNWIPTVFTGMGYSQNAALLAGTLLQVGGTIGTYGLAWIIARKGFVPVLVWTFAIAAVSIAFIGQPGLSFAAVSTI
ncbi:MAG TPA: MFS transporter, partial [Vicinamibacterales bacterium]|nr:MFS transporter [Vicinamibacterales bacterium]